MERLIKHIVKITKNKIVFIFWYWEEYPWYHTSIPITGGKFSYDYNNGDVMYSRSKKSWTKFPKFFANFKICSKIISPDNILDGILPGEKIIKKVRVRGIHPEDVPEPDKLTAITLSDNNHDIGDVYLQKIKLFKPNGIRIDLSGMNSYQIFHTYKIVKFLTPKDIKIVSDTSIISKTKFFLAKIDRATEEA